MQSFDELKEVVRRLRAEDGCPWDRAQTHTSLKAACIEEAAEVICGINVYEATGNAENLKEELGDLLFSVVNTARFLDVDAEEALTRSTDKFAKRFRDVEALAAARGIDMKTAPMPLIDSLWEEVK